MKRLILHIGPQKTASTFLQAHMVLNEELLREHGICYPRTFRVSPGHASVCFALQRETLADFETLHEEVAAFDTVILSTENFAKLPPESIDRLAAQFPGWEFQVLFFYRGQHELWPSHWQETVKHGSYEGWTEYLSRVLGFAEKVTLNYLNPEVILGRWARTLGSDCLRIFPYSAIGKDPRDALRPLCSLLDISPEILQIEERGRNASYPPERIEAIRALNRHAAIAGLERGTEVRRKYMKKHESLERSASFAALKEHFSKHSKTSVLRQNAAYLAQARRNILRKYGDLFMVPLPEAANKEEKIVTYIDPSFPIPDKIVKDIADKL